MPVYTSDTLSAPLSFAGNVEAKLQVSRDTPDADWAVKLVDVPPDGFARILVRGILRGRYRDSWLKAELMQPGKVCEITVDVGPVAAPLRKGDRLRVDICGADFPVYARNPNRAGGIFGNQTALATGQVHHQPGMLSRILLPVKEK